MNTLEGHLPVCSPLHDILAPSGIAVVGASADPTKRGYKAMVGLINGGYQGHIYPINPKADHILGVQAWPSLTEMPGCPELALLCTPAATVPALIAECGRRGVKGAVILASGFGETGEAGAALEAQMMEAARAHGVRIIGPNTSGMFNLHHQINLLALENVKPGDIGIVSQSGNMLLSLALEAQHNGQVGFSTYVGPGNQSDIGFNDYLRYLGEDEHTRVATLYVEGFRDGQQFLKVARDVTAMKPVVVYKSGATEQGQKAASSHTGALAGSYQMTVDLLRQAGVSVVQYSDEILPVAEGLGRLQKAPGKRVAVISDGGGQATIAADRLSEAGLTLAELSDATRSALREVLLPQASTLNPVDVAGSSDASPSLLARCIELVMADEGVDSVFLVGMFGGYSLRFAESLMGDEMCGAERMVELAQASEKPLVIYSLYAPIKPPALRRLHEAGLPVYSSIEHAVRVLAALGERGEYLANQQVQETIAPAAPSETGKAMLKAAKAEGRDLLEFEAKGLLAEHGIAVPEEWLVRREDELAEIFQRTQGKPLAMKVVSKDILHKSDAGGVKLNLVGEAPLRDAFQAIHSNAQAYDPNAQIEGVLVTPMAEKGVEVIIGMLRDPIFGPVLMFGLGGIFVEVLEDVAFRSLPLTLRDAQSMVDQLKAQKVLAGVRGAAGVDKQALVSLLMQVSQLVEAYPEISELDLNPVIAYPKGHSAANYAIVDARIIVERQS
ncbi:acyl-CoA synthetase [Vreelandella aquamarina]|uniref:Acetyltransferase n=1 Tax=Vreelandella aquamarina TaxID=77097 RepID=A0A1N6DX96_9GAMM|nr:acetate--CoA ligase [Halomonas meridiana]GED44932.1 acyl-CoA synthetase [Halomonas meridiana]SIN63326.1 acetyltransferase [Halomonas meridiana]SIN75405.1 acetyltransferase [Halomonas meridiana]SIO14767.1 acetyltransferase [Halomonas meridiana]